MTTGPRTTLGPCALHRRTLCLIDIENMACTNDITLCKVEEIQQRVNSTIDLCACHQTVIAASHHNSFEAAFGWKGAAQRYIRSGRDGADLALLEHIADYSWVAERYQQVVIASGDHIFATAVARLKAMGLEVVVIAPDHGLSAAMRFAAGPNLIHLGSAVPQNVTTLYRQNQDAA